MIIHTQRLRLRPWNDMDAPELYELARDPRIGMLCGWKPFECIDDAHEALSTVLAAPDSYAVTLRSTGEIVGSIALRIDTDSPRQPSLTSDTGSAHPTGATDTRRRRGTPSSSARVSWASRRSS